LAGRSELKTGKDRLILPIDVSTLDEARRLVDELYDYVGVFKIGLELLSGEGLAGLELFQQRGLKVFFDGKFLDIPNTVAHAAEAISRRGVEMFTVHSTGGSKMLAACAEASKKGAKEGGKPAPIVLGVTILTSLDQKSLADELGVGIPMKEQVLRLARLCQSSGVTGIVASAQEVHDLRTAFGDTMVLVTPGVRPSWAETNDQSRIVTPAQALRSGADYLVIGRPISAAKDRKDAAKRILAEMDEALSAVGS
jgi:orotidine-5'-phosphate decarboxylase